MKRRDIIKALLIAPAIIIANEGTKVEDTVSFTQVYDPSPLDVLKDAQVEIAFPDGSILRFKVESVGANEDGDIVFVKIPKSEWYQESVL